MVRFFVLLLVLVGCAAHRPAEPAVAPPPSGLAAAAFPEPRPEREGFVPRRRLEHTVTLGHDTFLPGAPAAAPGGPPGAAPLTIQNNVYVAPPPVNYGYGYGYGYPVYSTGTPRVTPVNPVTGTPPVGGDWPAPPSYGPRPMR